jgi:hypothetical protein
MVFQGAGSFVSEFDLTGQLKFSTLLGAYAGVQTSGIACRSEWKRLI